MSSAANGRICRSMRFPPAVPPPTYKGNQSKRRDPTRSKQHGRPRSRDLIVDRMELRHNISPVERKGFLPGGDLRLTASYQNIHRHENSKAHRKICMADILGDH